MDQGAPATVRQPQAICLEDYRPPAHLVDRIDLLFQLGEDVTRVTATSRMRRNPDSGGTQAALTLHGQDMELVSVSIDGRALEPSDYRIEAEALIVPTVPDEFEVEIVTEIKPQNNTQLEGLYKSSGNFCTQCEAEGFRKITYYPDRPDVMAVFTTRIEADVDHYPVLLSNGNKIEAGELPGGRHFAVWEDPFRKPAYLFALVAGRLVPVQDKYKTKSGRVVTLQIWVEPGNEDKCDHAMRSLIRAMKWDEDKYGLEYDLDIYMIVAVSDFNMGAMENKGLNIFNTKYVLAQPQTATDTDFTGVESVIAHEYFHNWTGNRVTCRDWFQLSLKEGLTVFRDQEFSADLNSRPVKRIADVARLRASQFPEDAGPMAHPVRPDSYIEISNFYTATVYEKGAEVIRMYQTLLGTDGFRKGMDLYFERHDGQAVTTDDFLAAMADANGADLGHFARWYAQAGTPVVSASGTYDAAARRYSLTLKQHTPPTPGQTEKLPLHIPVAMGLLDGDGADQPLRQDGDSGGGRTTRVLDLTEAKQTFEFSDVAPGPDGGAPVPSLLRGFSAPVRLEAGYSTADLAFLMAHDSDAFARWEAGQTLASQLMLGLVAEHQAGKPLTLEPAFIEAIRRVLDDPNLDRMFAAQMLGLPSESYIAEQMPVIDFDAIHAVRRFVVATIGAELRDSFLKVYQATRDDRPYSISPREMGRRALGNRALAYISFAEDDTAASLCSDQFHQSNNMTDRMAALACLNDMDRPERSFALAAFYGDWQEEPLVVDKWLALQAMSSLPDTLERVQELMHHDAFSIRNPNKVRALLGSFAFGNPVWFNAADGRGYMFLADRLIELDRLNPQVAARLASAFSRWRRMDETRQGLIRAQLDRVLSAPGLSKDVYEIVSKTLA